MRFCLLPLLLLAACSHRDGSQLATATPGSQLRSGVIALDLRTDKPSYRLGDPMQIRLTSDRPATIQVYNLDANGRRTPLWPRAGTKARVLRPGQTLVLPPAGADWRITASEPLGVNTLVAAAEAAASPAQPAASTPARPEFFQMHTGGWKGLQIEPESATVPNGSAEGEVRWLYRVTR